MILIPFVDVHCIWYTINGLFESDKLT